jgi:hypothetical protein
VHLDRINNNYSLDGLNYIYSQNDVFVTREINKIVLQKWEELGMQEDIKIFSYRPLPTVQNRSSGNRSSASGNGRENTDWVLPVVIMTMVGIIIGGSVVLSL